MCIYYVEHIRTFNAIKALLSEKVSCRLLTAIGYSYSASIRVYERARHN